MSINKSNGHRKYRKTGPNNLSSDKKSPQKHAYSPFSRLHPKEGWGKEYRDEKLADDEFRPGKKSTYIIYRLID